MAQLITDIIDAGIEWVLLKLSNGRAYTGTGGGYQFVVVSFDGEQGFTPGYDGTMASGNTVQHLPRESAKLLYQDAENKVK